MKTKREYKKNYKTKKEVKIKKRNKTNNSAKAEKNNKIKIVMQDKYIISTLIITILFIIMLVMFYQNITLKLKRNELNEYLKEYQLLKEEIDYLTEIKEKYEVIVKNNEELQTENTNLENKITELNNKINNLNTKIDKLK